SRADHRRARRRPAPGRRGERPGHRDRARGAGEDLREVLPDRSKRHAGPSGQRGRPGAGPPCRRGARRRRHGREPAGRGKAFQAPAAARWGVMAKILIVDDEPEIVRGLEDNLRFEGYQTASAANGEEALALALSGAPDLILLDVMMPRMSGWDVCRAL